jgi:hypothetical protein
MGFLVRLLFWLALPATVVGVPAAFVWLALDSEPLVARVAEISPDDMRRAEALLKRLDPRRIKAGAPTAVVATEQQLNSAIRAGLANVTGVKSRVAVGPRGLLVAATADVPMPYGRLGRFVNMRVVFAPSTDGLEISSVRIGRLTMPSSLARPILQAVIETLAGPGVGAELIDSVRSLSVRDKTVSVEFKPPKAMVARVKAVVKRVARGGKPEVVRVYYIKLIELSRRQGSRSPTSLTAFVQPLFRLAGERSRTGNPIDENRAAILALSLYFGDQRIENVVGDVLGADMRRKRRQTDHVRLDRKSVV